MPDTRLILHVKGTAAETVELPKEVVRAGISEGKITRSQLIWRPEENAWKQVRELPDLLPTERLILHVKGTESETRELPKHAVRAGISEGKITHSQLIWRPEENAWKQVRELPDLLPSQKVAPSPSRVAASPVRDADEAVIPESPNSPVARAVVAAETTPQARGAAAPPTIALQVRAAAAPPTVAPQIRAAAAPPTVAPQVRAAAALPTVAPQVRVATASPTVAPQVRVAAGSPTVAPRVGAAATSTPAPMPQVRAAAAVASVGTPLAKAPAPVLVRTTGELEVKHKEDFHLFKWICIALGLLILVVVGINYLLVDKPLVSNLDQTRYGNIVVYAHLGAFVQPNVVVIHIPTTSTITPQNLTRYLVELARSTPQNPINHQLFGRVALTNGWTAQYSFDGFIWHQLGEKTQESDDERKKFLMENLDDAGGESLMPESTLNDEAQQAGRDKVWGDFVAHFTAKP